MVDRIDHVPPVLVVVADVAAKNDAGADRRRREKTAWIDLGGAQRAAGLVQAHAPAAASPGTHSHDTSRHVYGPSPGTHGCSRHVVELSNSTQLGAARPAGCPLENRASSYKLTLYCMTVRMREARSFASSAMDPLNRASTVA